MSDSDDGDGRAQNRTPDLVQDEDDADLFGDDDDDEQREEAEPRRLDDPELDSGDDLDRDDRIAATVEDEPEYETRPLKLLDVDVPRINYPVGDEFYLLNMPPFLGARQENFDPDNFEPPKLPHDGDPNRQTSAYSTAMSSLFWRRDPQHSDTLQSTARLVRWEDGSLTLQLATKPTEHYRISTTAMRESFGRKLPPNHPYDPTKDSLTFLAAPLQSDTMDLHLVRALDATMKVMPSGTDEDESTARLKAILASSQQTHDPLARMKEIKEDPEQARRAAELFEKERIRAQRKRESAEERLTLKRNQVLGRSAFGRSGGTGLTAAGLEDEMGMPVSRGTKAKKRRKTNRRGIIYSDDEDELMPRGRTREDEYDREDDFLADSDEEPEVMGDDEDLLDDDEDDPDKDDLEIEGKQTVLEGRGRQRDASPQKRKRLADVEEDDDDDDDAEGEPDDEVLGRQPQSPPVRKTRRVIEDEDEE